MNPTPPRALVPALASALLLAACGGVKQPVSFESLADGDVVGGPQHTHFVIDTDKDVVRVELYLDRQRVGEAPFAPFDIDWSTVGMDEGEQTLRGIAYLVDGTQVSGAIRVRVDNTPPVINAPPAIEVGLAVRISVHDNTGVASVEAHVGDTAIPVQRDFGSEYVLTWAEPCGSSTIDLVAIDDAGWRTTVHAPIVAFDKSDADCDGHQSKAVGGDDCDDTNAAVHPGADDPGTTSDLNCDGLPGVDADHDGYASVETHGLDCNDHDPLVHPQPSTWTKTPLVDSDGAAITWTPHHAWASRDSSGSWRLVINHGGAIDLVTGTPGTSLRRVSLVTGADDTPIAVSGDATSHYLAYVKGTELHVRRWVDDNDPEVGKTDEIAITAKDPIDTPSMTNTTGSLTVAAYAGSSLWIARRGDTVRDDART